MHRLSIPGGDHPAVVDALEFIAAYKIGEPLTGVKSVVVIGAGNTAIDAAVAAKRLGAHEVTIIYRRDAASISAFDFEFEHAKLEGVEFLWWTLPVGFSAAVEGELQSLVCVRTNINTNGELESTAEPAFEVPCDLVIPAIGQSPLVDFLAQVRGVTVEKGRVVIDRATGATSNPRYFAGGDCVNGGREVVDAVADGKRAAVAIVTYFATSSTATGTAVLHG